MTTTAMTAMTPAAIMPDAKATVEQRGRGSADPSTTDAERDFDGLLTGLDDASGGDASAAQASVIGDSASMLAGSRLAGEMSLITTLVDRAAGASEGATRSKPAAPDDDGGSSSQASAQSGIPPALMSLLAGMPVAAAGGTPVGAAGLEAAGAGIKDVDPATLRGAATMRARAAPATPSAGNVALEAEAPDTKMPDDTPTKVDAVKASDAEAAATRSGPVSTVSTAMPAPPTENVAIAAGTLGARGMGPDGSMPDDTSTRTGPVAASGAEAVAARSGPVSIASATMPTPLVETAAIAAGSLGTRGAAAEARAETSPRVEAADALAARDGSDGSVAQPVSVPAQVAPRTSAPAGPPARTVSATKDATATPDDAAERPSAATGKTDAPAQDAQMPMPAPIATIADAVSALAAAPAAAPVPSPAATPTLAPARTMLLQLAPADLGTVAVRLHLTGQTLDVQLSVSDPKTLGLVSRERDALAARLDDRGYQLNTLTIQGTEPSASSTAGPHDSSHTGAGASANQDADGGRRGASGQTGRQAGQRTSGDRARGGDASVDGRGGLYI